MDSIQTHPSSAVDAKNFIAPGSLSFPGGAADITPPSTNEAVAGKQQVTPAAPVAASPPATPAATPAATQGVSGIVPTLQNIVATVNLDCRLDLKTIALHARNAEYNPKRFAAVIMRIRDPKTTALIFASGKMVVTGAKSDVDRGTLEICLHLIVLSLCVVMAGSGHLQTFKLLRFLRSRNSADGQVNYGVQMAVSLAIGFLFLGGGMQTFSTSNSSVAALLITLYPRLPTGPNDNRCHFQAFRHFYVLATEARWIQTVDVDTGLPVYAPLEVTVRETEHYAETSFCEVTPCLLPERAILKTLRICGPRYWPQVIDLVPEDKPWWTSGDKSSPFNSGVLYIKRKVGACSYIDDPVGCQSLLSRAMHKVFGLTTLKGPSPSSSGQNGPGSVTVDQLVGTFSSDPSLIAFAQLCCDPSWKSRSDIDFQEFCLQVLFECVSKDRPALLQVYLSLYTTMGSMAGQVTSDTVVLCDSLSVSNLKLALAYNEALLSGRLTSSRGGIVQSNFIACLRKQVEALLDCSQDLKDDFCNYIYSGKWPNVEESLGNKRSILLSWYLQWFCVPSPSAVKTAVDRVRPKLKSSSSLVPFLRLLFPKAHVNAITEIDKLFSSTDGR